MKLSQREVIELLVRASRSGRFQSFAAPEFAGLAGLPAFVGGDTADVLLCMRCDDAHPLLFLDNLIGHCGDCGCRVQYRPDAPITTGRTRLQCVFCTAVERL